MKKGISLIALVITIAVVITLVSTIVFTGTNVYNNTKKVKFATEISYVEELVKTYKTNNNGKLPISKVLYFDVSNISDSDIAEQFSNEIINNNKIALVKIDFDKLNPKELFFQNLNNSTSDNIYCFSLTTGKTYYIKGVKIGGKTYYTLTDELKENINYVENNNINDNILFLYNNNFNNKGEIDIKVPSSYIDVSVTSSDNSFEVTKESIDEYDVYKTNSSINSTITVKYKLTAEGNEKEIKYTVDNVDTVSPILELSDLKTFSNDNTQKKYITVDTLNDDFSGIKSLKYANLEIDTSIAKEYFKNGGITVEDSIINVESSFGTITVYAEDNAGNFTIKYVKIDEDTEYDYIKNGMVLLLDGIKNTREGHVTDTSIWEDLSGNNYDITMENISINNNNMYFNGTDSNMYSNDSINVVSVEMVLELEKTSFKSVYIASFGSRDKILAWCFINNSFSLGHYKERYFVDNLYKASSISVQYDPDSMYFNCEKLELNMEKASWSKSPLYPFTIGFYGSSNNYRVKGKIYSVRAYNRVLTEEEIKHNYEVDKARFNLK